MIKLFRIIPSEYILRSTKSVEHRKRSSGLLKHLLISLLPKQKHIMRVLARNALITLIICSKITTLLLGKMKEINHLIVVRKEE
jgi:hypothetical protein